MSAIRDKWNQIYAGSSVAARPAEVLNDKVQWLPEAGHCLDIACGLGANSLFLAQRGLTVDAWDISDVATAHLERLIQAQGLDSIRAATLHITPADLLPGRYDVMVNIHYLDRNLTSAIIAALKPGGLIFFQTFTQDKIINVGPSNPDFLLARDELPEMFEGLQLLCYQDEGRNPDPDSPLAGQAYIVAKKES